MAPHNDRLEAMPTSSTQEAISGWRLATIFFCLSICLLLSLMDETIVSTALVAISIEFNNFQNSLWIVLGYTLTYLGFSLLSSRLADVYGRRLVVLVGTAIFVAFSLASGFAQSMTQLIAFRTLQGLGGSIMYSMTNICFPEMSPLHLLPLASTIVGIVLAVAVSMGPVLGGVITSYTTWRWIFWLNAPVLVPTMAVLWYVWPVDSENTRGSHLVHVTLSQIDFVGAGLLLLLTTVFTFGIQEAGSRASLWSSPTVIAMLTLAGIAIVALGLWSYSIHRFQRFSNVAEILPWRVLTNRVLVAAIATTLLTGFTGLLVVIQLPIYFQIVNVLSAVKSGIHLLPAVIATAVGVAVGGIVSMKNNYNFQTLVAGNILLIVGCALYSVTPISFDIPHILYGSQVITGFGAGLTFCCTTMTISLNAEFKDHALSQGLLSQARVIGGTLGVATSSALLANHISDLTDVLSIEQISTLYRNPAYITQLNLTQQVAVRQAFAEAFNQSLRICTYIAVVSLFVSFFVWQKHPPTIEERKNQLEAAIMSGPHLERVELMPVDEARRKS